MSKKIDKNADGTQNFATVVDGFIGETPENKRRVAWQMFGTDASNAMTAKQAIELAQLNTPVTKQPCFAFIDGNYVEVEDKWVTGSYNPTQPELWRPHGVVGNGYEVVQNEEQFEMLDSIVDESGAYYETAGSMGNGKQVFVTMKLPNTMSFNGGEDKVDLYLLAQNSHDGTKAFTLAVTPIRLSCTNQLNMALRNAKRVFRLKHTRNVMSKVNEARNALALTFNYVEAFERQVQELIEQEMTDKQFASFANDYCGMVSQTKTDKQLARSEAKFDVLMDLWKSDTQLVAGRNAWSAYNAVTEYVDWFSGTRKAKATDDEMARAMRTLSHNADREKDRALNLLVGSNY